MSLKCPWFRWYVLQDSLTHPSDKQALLQESWRPWSTFLSDGPKLIRISSASPFVPGCSTAEETTKTVCCIYLRQYTSKIQWYAAEHLLLDTGALDAGLMFAGVPSTIRHGLHQTMKNAHSSSWQLYFIFNALASRTQVLEELLVFQQW